MRTSHSAVAESSKATQGFGTLVSDGLADALRSEIPCDASSAALLSTLVREQVRHLGGSLEDSDADLVVRLRDPRTYGDFVERAVDDPRVPPGLCEALLEHVFDLLPLPRTEADVIDVEGRAPPHLLALAVQLAGFSGLSVLHIMHLVYAVFLDRSLFLSVPRPVRSELYHAVVRHSDAALDLRVLYAGLHLATVPEAEAASELRRSLRSRGGSENLRRALATLVSGADGGRATLAAAARREGLMSGGASDDQEPVFVANIPRMPARLAAVGRKYLQRP